MQEIKNFFFNIFRAITKLIYFVLKGFVKKEYVIISGYKARFFDGNSRYLFLYMIEQNPSIRFYFYTKDKITFKNLSRQYPGKILYPYSLETFLRLLKAKVLIITTGIDDFSPYPLFGDKVVINIWHGMPIKKVGVLFNNKDKNRFELFSKSLDYFCVSSEFDAANIQNAFKLPEQKLFISGLPKNDFFLMTYSDFIKKHSFLNKKIVLYAPTFREPEMKYTNLDELLPPYKLNALLEKYDAYFLYRMHLNTKEQKSISGYNRIINASSQVFPDAQSLLYYTDILITDYSGIYFDFLLLDRPIIFYDYDIEEYIQRRGFLFDYFENTPGPKVQMPNEVLREIEIYLNNPELDSKKRQRICNRFHKYQDGNNRQRVFNLIMNNI